MARIRTIKPEFWSDEKLSECSLSARLLFIGLISFADDAGRMEFSPHRIRMQIFPCGSVKPKDLTAMLGELSERSLIRLYSVDSDDFLDIPGFSKHQKINRPTPSKLPEYSRRNVGELSESSVSPTESRLGIGSGSGSGMEGKGRDHSQSARESSVSPHCDEARSPLPNSPSTTTATRVPNGHADPIGEVERLKAAYPRGIYLEANWTVAEHRAQHLVGNGEARWEQLIAGAERYGRQMEACGRIGTQYVMSPEKFFTDGKWRDPFPLPEVQTSPARRPYVRSVTAAEMEAEIAQGLRNAEGTWISPEPNPHV